MEASARIGLADSGQSIWIDCIRRGMITSGELARLIEEDGVRGVTSNPSIFEKAIAGSRDYDVIIRRLALQGETPKQIYEDLAVKDVQMAADLFRGMYDRLQGRDGFVSLEVSPLLAHDTEGTVAEARRLWQAVSRPNLFIEVPATSEGLPAITRLIGEGINVNVTLLFGLPRYTEVVEAYIAGLEALASRGGQLDRVASVASFFLSRIDSAVDPLLSRKAQDAGKDGQTASRLRGEVAVASAKIAYHIFKNLFGRPGFQALARKGARVQRLLWASTSTKDPSYSDVKYVDPLVGPDTINTMTLETLNAFRDHGQPGSRIDADVDSAFRVLAELKHLGIDLSAVTQGLENEGLDRFTHALQRLLATIDQRSSTALKGSLDRQELHLGGHEAATWKRVDELEAKYFGRRLWLKDPPSGLLTRRSNRASGEASTGSAWRRRWRRP